MVRKKKRRRRRRRTTEPKRSSSSLVPGWLSCHRHVGANHPWQPITFHVSVHKWIWCAYLCIAVLDLDDSLWGEEEEEEEAR